MKFYSPFYAFKDPFLCDLTLTDVTFALLYIQPAGFIDKSTDVSIIPLTYINIAINTGQIIRVCLFDCFELEFYSTVNMVKEMLSQSVNQLTLFLSRFSLQSGLPVLVCLFELEFYGQINTVTVTSSQSINLLILF